MPFMHYRFCGSPLHQRPRLGGFTLIEVLIAVAILGILMGIASPSMRDMITNSRLQGASSDLIADLSLARGTAAAKGQRVTMCTSSDGATCSTSSLWHQGWIVFVDGNSNGTFEAANDTMIKVREALNSVVTVAPYTATGSPLALNAADNTVLAVRYRPSGPTTNSAAVGFRVCQNGFVYRDVIVSGLGRISSSVSSARATAQTTTSCS